MSDKDKCLLDACDDPDCVFCQEDDGDAAFWDEFMNDSTDELSDLADTFISLVDEETGESISLEGLNILPYQLIRSE